MPETARLTSDAQEDLEYIKSTYDVDVNTSKIVELALEHLKEKVDG